MYQDAEMFFKCFDVLEEKNCKYFLIPRLSISKLLAISERKAYGCIFS
jgi:hypothetical protein